MTARFLADENVPRVAVEALRAAGVEVAWVRTDAPGISDDEVLARAVAEQRVLLTFDKDFGELVFHRGAAASCGVVLFRILPGSPDEMAQVVADVIGSRVDWPGSFAVVEADRVRMRRLT